VLVTMVNSVDDYVAGEQYEIDDATAERFVVLGYALGDIGRDLSPEEIAAAAEGHQAIGATGVSFGG